MSVTDETIRMSGRAATIIRPSGNVSTFMISEQTGLSSGKRRADPYTDFEATMMLPTDSGVVSGDLILCDDIYYLTMSLERKYLSGEFEYYRGMLYQCNRLANIYVIGAGGKKHDTLVNGNIPCLITQVYSKGTADDKAVIISSYHGRTMPFQCYMQDTSGLTNTSIIIDGDGKRYRVLKDFDVFVSDGVIQCQVVWEN